MRQLFIPLICILLLAACRQNQAENHPVSTEPASFPADTENAEPKDDIVHLGTPWADFNLRFDPQEWDSTAFREDAPELGALSRPTLAGGCRITPNIPVGLGEGWVIEERRVPLGQLELDTKAFSENGVRKFVAY